VRLVILYSGALHAADARLVRLAEFLGAQCELLHVESGVTLSPEYLEHRVADKNSCFVLNPSEIRQWLPSESFPPSLASFLTSRFSFVLVHNLSLDDFSASIVSALSGVSLHSLCPVEKLGLGYEVASERKLICGSFSGLNFGSVNLANDRVFAGNPNATDIRTHIAIGGHPFFASIQRERAEVFFLAGAELADLDAIMRPELLSNAFSKLIPPAMFIRYAFRGECWHPNQHYATLIIDDPLLRKTYGFLNFESLLGLMDEDKFHTCIAFIPHNWRRNASRIIRIFRERPDRFSICFHGNDHTGAEFATQDAGLLNTMVTVAEERMAVHEKQTGVRCNKVMVFPQGKFSLNAMNALKAHNFSAAVNSGAYALGEDIHFTLAEILQPAILKYGGFPLFLRKYVRKIASADIAFDLFFGKPVFIVEHHEIFKDIASLTELTSRIYSRAPDIIWSNLTTAIQNSHLMRRAPDGALEVRAYANLGTIKNTSDTPIRCRVEWPEPNEIPVQAILLDGVPRPDAQSDDKGVRLSFELPPGESRLFSVVYRNDYRLSDKNNRLRNTTKAFLRRRLSEFRDNHVSKNPRLLSMLKKVLKRSRKRSKE
jgi:hypothetical protein